MFFHQNFIGHNYRYCFCLFSPSKMPKKFNLNIYNIQYLIYSTLTLSLVLSFRSNHWWLYSVWSLGHPGPFEKEILADSGMGLFLLWTQKVANKHMPVLTKTCLTWVLMMIKECNLEHLFTKVTKPDICTLLCSVQFVHTVKLLCNQLHTY